MQPSPRVFEKLLNDGLASSFDIKLGEFIAGGLGAFESHIICTLRDYAVHCGIDPSFLGETPAGWSVGQQIIAGCSIFEPKAAQIRQFLERAPNKFLKGGANAGATVFVHGCLHSSTGS